MVIASPRPNNLPYFALYIRNLLYPYNEFAVISIANCVFRMLSSHPGDNDGGSVEPRFE